jgi:hypothetical protein
MPATADCPSTAGLAAAGSGRNPELRPCGLFWARYAVSDLYSCSWVQYSPSGVFRFAVTSGYVTGIAWDFTTLF